MATASIKVRGLDEVNATLGRVLELPKSTLPKVLTEAGAILLNRVRTRFLAETDPAGMKWQKSAAARKRSQGKGGGTLFDTGRLFRSITLKKPKPLERVIFTDVPYAAAHQLGRGRLPQRAFLGFSAGDITVIERLVNARVQEALRG